MKNPHTFTVYFPRIYNQRAISTKLKVVADLDPEVREKIENQSLKPRKHPGVLKSNLISLPTGIQKSIVQVVGDYSMKRLISDGKNFNNFLLSRFPPAEKNEIEDAKNSIQKEVEESMSFLKVGASDELLKHYNQVVDSKVTNMLKKHIYNWKTIDYSRYIGLLYAINRAPAEFSVLVHIFNELKQRLEEDKQPTTVFDFGSGVGTVTWASEEVWSGRVNEYFNVDSSGDMNNIAMGILENAEFNMNKVFFRQFLPASHDRKYDIVVSAYSLLDLPSQSNRLQTLVNLWNKTKRYLIIVERGSNASFKVVNEARDFIIHNSKRNDGTIRSHVFSPCPHEMECPRITADDKTPCNFIVKYTNPFVDKKSHNELFTYVILAKEPRPATDPKWPRIVRPVLVKSRHSICRLCTSSGNLQEIIFSPTKPDRTTYNCARSSKWGDLLPVDIKCKSVPPD